MTPTPLFLLQLSVFFLTTSVCFYLFHYEHLIMYLPINTFSIIHVWPLIIRTFANRIWSSDFLDLPTSLFWKSDFHHSSMKNVTFEGHVYAR
jgi:hypothetical protein